MGPPRIADVNEKFYAERKASMNISYDWDTHWYGQGYKLWNLALKAQEKAAAEAENDKVSV